MNQHEYIRARQGILAAVNAVVPTGVEQANFSKLANEMEAREVDNKLILTRLVKHLHYGLIHGTWPVCTSK